MRAGRRRGLAPRRRRRQAEPRAGARDGAPAGRGGPPGGGGVSRDIPRRRDGGREEGPGQRGRRPGGGANSGGPAGLHRRHGETGRARGRPRGGVAVRPQRSPRRRRRDRTGKAGGGGAAAAGEAEEGLPAAAPGAPSGKEAGPGGRGRHRRRRPAGRAAVLRRGRIPPAGPHGEEPARQDPGEPSLLHAVPDSLVDRSAPAPTPPARRRASSGTAT